MKRVIVCVLLVMVLVVPCVVSATDTVSQFTPGTNAESDMIRKTAYTTGTYENFTTITHGDATNMSPTRASAGGLTWSTSTTANNYTEWSRYGYCVNTSTIPDTATITNVTATTINSNTGSRGWSTPHNPQWAAMRFYPSDPTTLALTDYDNNGTYLNASVGYVDLNGGAADRHFFNIPSTDYDFVNKTGYTCIMWDHEYFAFNTTWSWKSGVFDKFTYIDVSVSGADPYMNITWNDDADTTPPELPSSITNQTFCRMLNWTINYNTTDVQTVMTWKDGVFLQNLTTPTSTLKFHNLTPGTEYTIATKTVDLEGNANASFYNVSANTNASCPTWPKVLIDIDDANQSVIDYAYPILEAYNFNATIYAVTNDIGSNDTVVMDTSDLTTLYNEGWDIADHGTFHANLPDYNVTEQRAIIGDAKDWLIAQGFTRAAGHMAYPYGAYDSNTITAMTAEEMKTGRTVIIGNTIIPMSGLYSMPIYNYVQNTYPPNDVVQWIRNGHENHTTRILFHRFDATGSSTYYYNATKFAEFAQMVYDEGYEPITISQWYTLNGGDAVPPEAYILSNVTGGSEPLAVGFTDNSIYSPTAWNWSFTNITPGNNTEVWFAQTQNPTHVFGVGNFSIKLNCSNAYGSNISAETYFINVSAAAGSAPVANFSANVTSGTAPLKVGFTDSSTNTPTSWNWSFNNVTGNNTVVWWSTTQSPSITLGVGNFTFTLNATNAIGSNLTSGNYWVNVSAGATPDTTPPELISGLTNDTSTCGAITWNWTNPSDLDFSHVYAFFGNTWNQNVTTPSHSITWTSLTGGATYSLNATTVDTFENVNASWMNASATVVQCPSVASFSTSDATPAPGDTVTFTDLSTYTPNNWDWYWDADETKSSDLQNPSTSFATEGTYGIRLYASNAAGGSWSNQSIVVSNTTAGTYSFEMYSIYGAMIILGICPILAGIGLAMYGLSGTGATGRSRSAYIEDTSTYLMAGVVAIILGVLVLVIIFMLMPVFAGAAEGII